MMRFITSSRTRAAPADVQPFTLDDAWHEAEKLGTVGCEAASFGPGYNATIRVDGGASMSFCRGKGKTPVEALMNAINEASKFAVLR